MTYTTFKNHDLEKLGSFRGRNESETEMATKKMSLRRFAATVGVFALATSGVLVSAGAATAVSPNEGTPPGQAGANATGSLTVHKRSGVQDADFPNNGTAIEGDVPGEALADVPFTAQRIGTTVDGVCVAIDLHTTAGWTAATGVIDGVIDPCDVEGGATVQVTEEGTGIAEFPNLALGLYYVTEGDADANIGIIEKAVPFYVTIPFASNSGTEAEPVTTWLYDVHVYPKNAVADAPTKEITDRPSAVVIGSNVTWTITQTVPALADPAKEYTSVTVADTLDPRLTFVSSTVAIGGVPLAIPTDVTLTNIDGNLSWELTTTGLEKLNANVGEDLVVTVTTSVDSINSGDLTAGVIANEASVTLNDKTRPTDESFTYWGNLVVTKHDASNEDAPLEGASFAVFEITTGFECAELESAPTTGAAATGTSDGSGVVQWVSGSSEVSAQGLWIANSNSALPPSAQVKDYCLFETAAPAGYVADTAGVVVTITTEGNASVTKPVSNTKVPGPELPLTGASGTLMLTVLGLGLVGLGAGGVAIRKNRASKQH